MKYLIVILLFYPSIAYCQDCKLTEVKDEFTNEITYSSSRLIVFTNNKTSYQVKAIKTDKPYIIFAIFSGVKCYQMGNKISFKWGNGEISSYSNAIEDNCSGIFSVEIDEIFVSKIKKFGIDVMRVETKEGARNFTMFKTAKKKIKEDAICVFEL